MLRCCMRRSFVIGTGDIRLTGDPSINRDRRKVETRCVLMSLGSVERLED